MERKNGTNVYCMLCPIHHSRHVYIVYHIKSSHKSRKKALISLLL